ncbi:MAG: type III-B CRISPR module RAMP protein Cmr1, partial [Verrucomicrobia bacterium]|nr:type III-B CRISPR module RAMP protein Cmr1 [Verrucomicrobiota bacterium]
MTSQSISRSFRFLTPAFAHGAYQAQTDNIPELRAPSIRGQLRWWWRTLGYGSGDELFGSASGDHGSASKVQVRLICPPVVRLCTSQILPHKENPGHRGPKQAIQENENRFTVELRPVRESVDKKQ